MMVYLWERTVPDTAPPAVPEVHISYGQSWRSNSWPSFAGFSVNPQPQTLLALKISNIGSPTFGPGPLPNSAGIAIPTGSFLGLTGYQGSDYLAIGRCAVQSQQLLRVWRGLTPLTPILEFCAAYPGSTWATGLGGGLSPGASFTASITDGTMTVTAVASRQLAPGQLLTGAGVPTTFPVFILGGPNPGTTGTYNVAAATVVVAGPMRTAGGAAFTGQIGAAAPTDTLTVSAVSAGAITVGDTITSGAPAGTTIRANLTGSGGVGTYQVYVGGVHINISSQAFVSQGVSWNNQQTLLNEIQGLLPITLAAQFELPEPINRRNFDGYDPEVQQIAEVMADVSRMPGAISGSPRDGYASAVFRSVGYTQGTSYDNTSPTKVADLTDMLTLYDAMALPGTTTKRLNYYLGLPAATSDSTVFNAGYYGTYLFCRTHAPGQGGTWSGRCFATSPSYAWQFNGADNIHTGDYGTMRWGEFEGYVKHLVEDLGVMWTPLWRSLTQPIRVSGQTVIVPFDRPAGPDFAGSVLSWQSDPQDGIKVWPGNGFAVSRGASQLAIGTPVISGMNVVLTVTSSLSSGDVLTVTGAYNGPGGPSQGVNSGVGCNLVMNGPPSQLVPGKSIDAWMWPFNETVTV